MTIDLTILKQIQKTLNESEMQTVLLEAENSELPLDVLHTELSPDKKNRNQFLNFTLYPVKDTNISTRYLQLFSELPIQFSEQSKTIFVILLPFFNMKVALGHFGFNSTNSKAYFKYTFIVDELDVKNKERLTEIVGIINYTHTIYQTAFDLIENGSQEIEKIMQTFNQK